MGNDEKVNILVVDDLPDKLLALETVLEQLEQNVVTAVSGREALRRLLEQEFAVILLDVNMPDMDGFETAAMIRSRRQTAHTPIIFITAFGDEMHTSQGYSLGAVDYILSPVVPEVLRTKVGVFVDLHKKTQQVKLQAEQRIALVQEQAARAAAEEATRRSAFLAEASTVLVQSLDDDAIPRLLARQAVPFLGDLCAITLRVDRYRDDWKTEVAWSDAATDGAFHSTVTGKLPRNHLFEWVARVLESGETEFLPELGPALRKRDSPDAPDSWGESFDPEGAYLPRAVIVVPLRARGRTVGTIALALRDGRRRYGATDLALAEDLAGRAAVAIDNARLYRDIQENDRRKNEFLAMLAHELRNPMAPIRNAVYALRKLDRKNSELQWATDIITRQVEQMVRLVDDLLDISRITGGKIQLQKKPVDIAGIVARAVETSRPLIDARCHVLNVSLPSPTLFVDGDQVRLSQVLANLLNNAAKYTEERGTIELDVKRDEESVVFRVRDNGVGISSEMLSSVFDLFTQVDRSLDRSQGGLGIGLTLVRRLVELHGGSVKAISNGSNQGSEFIVRLPILGVQRAPEPATADDTSEDAPAASSRRILLVDDNLDAARSLAKLLQMAGHHVRVAPDGPTGLAELSVYRPDVVLLDIGLPGMDGYEVARSIRTRPGDETLVLVALTGYGQNEDRKQSQDAGFNYHMVKPVDPDALFALVATVKKRVNDTESTPGLLSRA